ncbi:MAG: topoisomerase C-terminal repeat-containing protein, partial [Synechococcales cyanobacterium]
YGPYLSHAPESGDKPEFRSLKGEDDVLSITLERAVQLLADPKWGRGVRGTSTQPLRELGLHPQDGQPIHIYDGRYGPYLKYGKVNASIPEGESVESITLATALNLIAAKATTQKQKRSPKSTSKTVQKGETSTQKTTVRQRSSEATKKSRSKSTGNVSKTKKQST